jgi:hypothetical protein
VTKVRDAAAPSTASRSPSPALRGRIPYLCIAAALLTAGCVSHERLDPDYGVAVRADAAAQIANPDAHYLGYPQPGYSGVRASLAERRYDTGRVIRPNVSTTSGLSGNGSGNAPSGDASAGDAGPAPAPPPQ